jgi:hypothetical protein
MSKLQEPVLERAEKKQTEEGVKIWREWDG